MLDQFVDCRRRVLTFRYRKLEMAAAGAVFTDHADLETRDDPHATHPRLFMFRSYVVVPARGSRERQGALFLPIIANYRLTIIADYRNYSSTPAATLPVRLEPVMFNVHDPVRPFRGLINGLAISAAFFFLIAFVAVPLMQAGANRVEKATAEDFRAAPRSIALAMREARSGR